MLTEKSAVSTEDIVLTELYLPEIDYNAMLGGLEDVGCDKFVAESSVHLFRSEDKLYPFSVDDLTLAFVLSEQCDVSSIIAEIEDLEDNLDNIGLAEDHRRTLLDRVLGPDQLRMGKDNPYLQKSRQAYSVVSSVSDAKKYMKALRVMFKAAADNVMMEGIENISDYQGLLQARYHPAGEIVFPLLSRWNKDSSIKPHYKFLELAKEAAVKKAADVTKPGKELYQ